MRWRLFILLMSVTAAFCFMLLTAVTDYGSGQSNPAPMISAAMAPPPAASASKPLLLLLPMPERAVEARISRLETDPLLKPNVPQMYVARNADPVTARRQAEEAEHRNLGKPSHRRRLKWDEHGWHREEVALVTAYCPCSRCCGSQAAGITSIGKNAWTPGLAADPIYLNYGTRVFVPGYGVSSIDDTGGAMRRHWRRDGILHIDVRMTYHYEARQWGKQFLKVKIYEEE